MKSRFEREEKFDKIYRKYGSVVYNVAMGLLHDKETASDVVQETFWHYHERMDSVNDASVKAYLIVSAKHLSYNYVRDEKHEIQSENVETEAGKTEASSESAEEIYFCGERRKMKIQLGAEIFEALREKNEVWYRIMYLAYVEGWSYDEIADELGLTKEVLYCRVYRAKEWVQKEYGYKFEDVEAFT